MNQEIFYNNDIIIDNEIYTVQAIVKYDIDLDACNGDGRGGKKEIYIEDIEIDSIFDVNGYEVTTSIQGNLLQKFYNEIQETVEVE